MQDVKTTRARSRFPNPQSALRNPQSGFTLLELLIAIGIIVLLIGILIPTVSRVRTAARQADTRAQIAAIAAACENYYADFRAYPGPIANDELANGSSIFPNPAKFPGGLTTSVPVGVTGFYTANPPADDLITGSENLVLGLLGGFRTEVIGGNATLVYDPSLVGKGANGLNPSNPKRSTAYLNTANISLRSVTFGGVTAMTGKWGDEAWRITGFDSGGPLDTTIPEFIDRYSDPMPILYLRARVGATSTGVASDGNGVVTVGASTVGTSQYDLNHVSAYTATIGTQSLGVGKKPPKYFAGGVIVTPPSFMHGLRDIAPASPITNSGPNQNQYQYPLQAFAYLRNHALSGGPGPFVTPNVARNKDGFILISAGTDRIYGTADDITNFGDVLP